MPKHALPFCLIFILVGTATACANPAVPQATVTGTMHAFLRDKMGKVVGGVLDDGTIIHWPRAAGRWVVQIVEIDDSIQISGRSRAAVGRDQLDASRITNLETQMSLEITRPPVPQPEPEKRMPSAPKKSRLIEFRSIVQGQIRSAEGVIEGLVLEDGSQILWTSKQGLRFAASVNIGDQMRGAVRASSPRQIVNLLDWQTGEWIDADGTVIAGVEKGRRSIEELEKRVTELEIELQAAHQALPKPSVAK